MAALVRALRQAILASAPRSQEFAEEAYDLLVRPFADLLTSGQDLLIVPDRELFSLPFSALRSSESGRHLALDHAITIVPDLLSFLRHADGEAILRPETAVVVGDPAFDPARFRHPRLPSAREEAIAIARLYPESQLLTGKQATASEILRALPSSRILHLATHVMVDQFAPLSSLVLTAKSTEGILQASDFSREKIGHLSLVFLSGCDTAPGFENGDREGVAGLARTLLASGVPAVVGTLWGVDDAAAAALSIEFHQQFRKGWDLPTALQKAQLSLAENDELSQPRFWAGFQLYMLETYPWRIGDNGA